MQAAERSFLCWVDGLDLESGWEVGVKLLLIRIKRCQLFGFSGNIPRNFIILLAPGIPEDQPELAEGVEYLHLPHWLFIKGIMFTRPGKTKWLLVLVCNR